MRITRLILTCVINFAVIFLPVSESKGSSELHYRGVRAMGMGNAFAAIADDGDAFYYNPAGLANVRKVRIDIQPIGLMPTQDLYGEISDLDELLDDMGAISESAEPLEDTNLKDERLRLMDRMENLARENLGLDAATPFRIIIPFNIGDYSLAIGGIVHGWSRSQIQFQRIGLRWSDFMKDMLNDEIFYNIMAEVSYGGAAAIEIPLSVLPLEISLGLTARRIHRWQLTDKDDMLGIEDLLNPYGKDGIEGTADDLKERYFDFDDPLAEIPQTTGYNMDLGAIAIFRDAVNLAIVSRNLAGKIGDEEIPRESEVAAAVNLAKLSTLAIPSLDIILAASLDIEDESSKEDEFINKTGFGLEIVWKPSVLTLSGRIGSNHGYMTLGAGVQLLFLDLDYAFYGDVDTDWHAFSLNLAF